MLRPPAPLGAAHSLEDFSCGKPGLDEWLHRRASNNQAHGASRTYVLAEGKKVVAYYSLSAGGIATADAPGSLRGNMPDPIPLALLGRLAIDLRWQGRGFGTALLRDAILRTAEAALIIGIRGLVVHAIDEDVRSFYLRKDFVASPTQPMTLFLSIKGMTPAA